MSTKGTPDPNLITPHGLLAREQTAEEVAMPSGSVFRLLADSSATSGALGANRLTLPEGADGARPHFHARSTEFFYVLEGRLEVRLGEALVMAETGDLV